MAKGCYIVSIGSPTYYVNYDWEHHVFLDYTDAENFFNETIKCLIEEIVDDMTEEEADEYRKIITENSSENYAEDDEGNWAVRLDKATFEK